MDNSAKRRGIPIKVAMIELGLFQRDVARSLDMPLTTFNMKLQGRRPFLEEERDRLAKVLRKPKEQLFPICDNTEAEQNTQAVSV